MPSESPLELLVPAKDINERVDRLEKVLLYPGPIVSQLPFVVLAEVTGKPSAGQLLTDLPLPIAMLFPANFKDSQVAVSTLPRSMARFSIRKNGAEFGALILNHDGSHTWNSQKAVLFAKGERVSIVAPTSRDATLAGVSISLLGWMQLD